MAAYKTTMFYEIQINKLLENIEGLSKEEIADIVKRHKEILRKKYNK